MDRTGSTMGNPVMISSTDHAEGVASEYEYLESVYGLQGEAWEFRSQAVYPRKRGRSFFVVLNCVHFTTVFGGTQGPGRGKTGCVSPTRVTSRQMLSLPKKVPGLSSRRG